MNASGCLLWSGSKNDYGYGVTTWKSKSWTVHRLSYALSKGIQVIQTKDADGNKLVVRHRCNTKLCFHPDHLVIGTYLENAADYAQMNQHPKTKTVWMRTW